ncbi:hypothetical protein [Rhizobium tubonense]|uniref:Uncharacterized protein n=1 Tax=Rhizobium tubonense TaxID=484088 RepID=A0A2W4CDC0_9HYPH|nr:hypothetical protein [Rhizobium tubonense]PZM11162.1 hypothetical protein CPY51_20480 [Rhizobium tubonense]
MQSEDFFTDEQVRDLFMKGLEWIGRIVRGISYFVIALLLIRINSYGLPNATYLAIAIGLLGSGSSSARVAQLSIAILLLMAVLPLNMIGAVKVAMR